MYDVIIIGGGVAGLSGAVRLAASGRRVLLLEQNDRVGGKMNEYRSDGYRFDTGPSLMTMPFVLEQLYADAGERLTDHLELAPLEPMCRYFFSDGTVFDADSDPDRMRGAIAKLSPQDAQGFDRFMAYSKRIYDLTAEVFLFTPIHEWKRLLHRRHLRTLWSIGDIDPFRTVHGGVTRYFRDPRLVQLFDRYATYNGSDPFRAPATLNIIPWVEVGLGGFYIRGGMYRLVESLAGLAQRCGAEIRTGTRVERLLIRSGRVHGVRCDGVDLPAQSVLCNADVVTAMNTLVDSSVRTRRRLWALEPSLSGVVFLWNMAGRYANLAHHNIFFTADYRREFDEIFRQGVLPDDPTIYVAITSRTDVRDAPADGENWFVLVNAPYLREGQDWPTGIDRLRKTVLKKLERAGLDVHDTIRAEKIITPEDIYRLYGSNRGSIYGISSNSRSMAFRRPANRSRQFRGLYFAGGSSHPGGGVPLALLSGRMAADLINDFMGNTYR